MKKIKIALGDLKHNTSGRHSVFMPVGVGLIASYTLAQIGKNNIEIKLYTDPDTILEDISIWKPNVVGLANYCWNSEVSRVVFRYAKKLNPSIVCVAGGPEFPVKEIECEEYLSTKPEIDFYVYFEGEVAFAELVKKIINGAGIERLRSEPQNSIMSIHPKSKKLVLGESLPRLTDLDVIPSPYLNGLMDQWFNGYYAPSIETARGCPFTCAYCFTGQERFCDVAVFSVERIKKDLTYIARKMKDYPHILLSLCDSNFGMYKRDEEIAEHCRELQGKYGWPNVFDVSTGKANYERILRISALLKNKMFITSSLQSLNSKTLEVIKRTNIPFKRYLEIQEERKKRGMLSIAELIVPLPEETKDSYFEGIKKVTDAGIERVYPYTTMLLKGTNLASAEYRDKYKMRTKFRIIPRQFGEYKGEKCFEIEEVCIATNTMSFEDYLDIRAFTLVSSFFSNEQFDIIHRHLEELKIGNYDFYYYLFRIIKSDKTALSAIYNRYINETKEELWDSRRDLYNYFRKQKNYVRLLRGDVGDNLLRKYTTELLLKTCTQSIKLAYSVIKNMRHDLNKETIDFLDKVEHWALTMRNINAVFKNEAYKNVNKIMNFSYDVNVWYCDNYSKPLLHYKKPITYRMFYEVDKLDNMLKQGEKLYGKDFYFRASKLLLNRDIKDFWCQCELIKKDKV